MRKIRFIALARIPRPIGVVAMAAVVVLASSSAWLPAIGHWLAMPATVEMQRVDAIAVLGGNPIRTDYALDLYRRGLAPELWQTGYARTVREFLVTIEHDSPRQAFHFLATSSTWSDGTQIAAAIRARKLHSVIIVTDWWHSRRALCSIEQQLQGYDVAISFEPSPSPAGSSNWWWNAEIRSDVGTELVKMVYYAVHYGMRPWDC